MPALPAKLIGSVRAPPGSRVFLNPSILWAPHKLGHILAAPEVVAEAFFPLALCREAYKPRHSDRPTAGNSAREPLRAGLRLGHNVGYLKFTTALTWNPF